MALEDMPGAPLVIKPAAAESAKRAQSLAAVQFHMQCSQLVS
jgi:hypothetical protein